jgi:hypothetical protein
MGNSVDLAATLSCTAPTVHTALHVDGVETVGLERVGGSPTTRSASAVDQICVLLLELSQAGLQIHEGDVLGVGDATDAPLEARPHVNDLEVGVGLVSPHHLLRFSYAHTHSIIIISR